MKKIVSTLLASTLALSMIPAVSATQTQEEILIPIFTQTLSTDAVSFRENFFAENSTVEEQSSYDDLLTIIQEKFQSENGLIATYLPTEAQFDQGDRMYYVDLETFTNYVETTNESDNADEEYIARLEEYPVAVYYGGTEEEFAKSPFTLFLELQEMGEEMDVPVRIEYGATGLDAYANPNTTLSYDPWAEPQIHFAQEKDLLVDSLGNDYTQKITRLQIADLLVNMVEQATGETLSPVAENPFNDTDNVQILKAYEAGIISGKDEVLGLFAPDAQATRQEMAIMLQKAIVAMAKEEALSDNGLSLADFNDGSAVADWAKDAMTTMVQSGILGGYEGALTPESNTSIQEAIVLSNNLFSLGE